MPWRWRRAAATAYGEIGSDGASVRRLVRKLERPGSRLRFCYEAGPTGYGLQRSIEGLGHECAVIAPSLIPRRIGAALEPIAHSHPNCGLGVCARSDCPGGIRRRLPDLQLTRSSRAAARRYG